MGDANSGAERGSKANPNNSKKIAAFFDVDRTLLEVNSGSAWIRHVWERGELSVVQLVRSLTWVLKYKLALLDFEAVARRAVALYAGRRVDALTLEVRRWFDQTIEPRICVEARERVEYHRERGHLLALLTSGSHFMADPVAEILGVEHVLCTELEADENGVLTGRHVPPACGGEGKVVHAERFAKDHDIDLGRSFFYTDSYSDMPMLERVGRPRVINPDPRLRRKARALGWGYELWRAT